MHKNFVLTLTGPDRIGIVDDLTEVLLNHGSNVETSRMARLGGEFAVLMLVSMPADQFVGLEKDLAHLIDQGYKVTTGQTEQASDATHPGWLPYQIEVHGADHEGIIHEVAHYLSQQRITIESMDTGTTRAPISGAPLFTMTALVLVPPTLPGDTWQADLEDIGHHLNVDIGVSALPHR
jgi:glycine cleavage system transcriptional repressor